MSLIPGLRQSEVPYFESGLACGGRRSASLWFSLSFSSSLFFLFEVNASQLSILMGLSCSMSHTVPLLASLQRAFWLR